MAPGYRAGGQSRRTNRGQVDHDVFEGLPVRNWRRDTVTVAPPARVDVTIAKNKWDVELPWGMPKDYHLLPPHSQDLLRLARSGKLYKKRPAPEEEEVDVDPLATEKQEKKEADTKDTGFSVKTWKAVPRHLEGPEPFEYLAKRRKGLRGAVVNGLGTAPIVTKATVRKMDAEGNTYVEEVLVAQGQAVEGEVISSTVITDPAVAAPDVATPLRRRPPPPKRRAKGPGRGRKKKTHAIPLPVPGGSVVANVVGDASTDTALTAVGPDGVKLDSQQIPVVDGTNGDTQMEDLDDEDGEDGEDGDDGDDGQSDEDGDDNDEGDGDDQDQEMLEQDDTNTSINLPSEVTKSSDVPADIAKPSAALQSTRLQLNEISSHPLKQAMSVSEPQSAALSPHDDDEEADGDDDDGHEDHPTPTPTSHQHHQRQQELDAPPTYYPSHANVIEPTTDQDFDDENDEQMLFHDEDNGQVLNPGNQFHTTHEFDYEQLQPHETMPFQPQEDQFSMPTSTENFAPVDEIDQSHELPSLHGDIDIMQHHSTDSIPAEQSDGPAEAQDSFEDLLGNDEIGDDDLMAGLDAHLLQNSGDPIGEVIEPVTPVVEEATAAEEEVAVSAEVPTHTAKLTLEPEQPADPAEPSAPGSSVEPMQPMELVEPAEPLLVQEEPAESIEISETTTETAPGLVAEVVEEKDIEPVHVSEPAAEVEPTTRPDLSAQPVLADSEPIAEFAVVADTDLSPIPVPEPETTAVAAVEAASPVQGSSEAQSERVPATEAKDEEEKEEKEESTAAAPDMRDSS